MFRSSRVGGCRLSGLRISGSRVWDGLGQKVFGVEGLDRARFHRVSAGFDRTVSRLRFGI